SIGDTPVRVGEESISVTCSLGSVSSSQAPGATPDLLIRASDAALYRAKSAGRDRVELASLADMAIGGAHSAPPNPTWAGLKAARASTQRGWPWVPICRRSARGTPESSKIC